MQELRFVAVSEDGSYAVLAVPGRSGRYILPIDERLRAVAQGQASRLAQYEIEVESPLRPKEIQARIRAGETAEEIADAAGIPVERVRWFEGPVLAERGYIADQAQAASVRRAGESSGPGPRLGDIVTERLSATGSDPADGQWDSRKRGDGNWQVSLTFPSGGRLHVAEWVFDPRRRHVMPDDDNAARLSLPESELPAEEVPMPAEATVTPIASRLGAAAGMGGVSGMGGGSAGSFGGPGVGVRAFRPDRSVIPDRSLGGDRSLADRSHSSAAPSPSVERPVALERPVTPERPAMTHVPAAPPMLPRPGHQSGYDAPGYDGGAGAGFRNAGSFRAPAPDQVDFRDESPEPTGYRDLTPDRPVYRDPSPDRAPAVEASSAPQVPAAAAAPAAQVPAAQVPVVFEEIPAAERVPVSSSRPVIFEEPEPAFPDEHLELPPAADSVPPEPAATVPDLSASASVTPQPVGRPADWTQSETGRHPSPAPESDVAPAAAADQADPPALAESTPAESAAAESTANESTADVPTAPGPAEPATVGTAESAAIGTVEPATEFSTESTAGTAAAADEPAAAAAPPEAETPASPPAEEQPARPRQPGKKNPKARRSSVPSWDEIMLGSTRQRD